MARPAEYLRSVNKFRVPYLSCAKSHHSPFESEIITIIVGTGDEARNFQLHKDVACGTSLFFFGCLATEHFPEGRLKTILLPEDDPGIFQVVLAFVYASNSLERPSLPNLPTSTYIMAYVLADKLLMQKICNNMMRSITACHNTRDAFSGALGGLTAFDLPECIATKFLIEQLAWEFCKKGYDYFCGCEVEEKEGDIACSWCQFLMSGGSGVVKMLKMLRGSEEEVVEPRMRPAAYWHESAHF
jgi:hypothetical protein